MRGTPPRAGVVLAALLAVASTACGKKGDPLPPVRRAPQPVTGLVIAQRGDRLELRLVAPRASTDGVRLGVHDVEILRADVPGEFGKVARRETKRAAPGETLVETGPLPPPGTTLRVAARAVAKGRASLSTDVASLTVQPPPPPPTGLTVRSSSKGAALQWTPSPMPVAPPASPSPQLAPSLSPEVASPEPETALTTEGAPAPSASAQASPAPEPPVRGVWIYRRGKRDVYAQPLSPTPVMASVFEDAAVRPGEEWCYVTRSVVSTDPVIESADSEEACLRIEDVSAPSAPAGLTALDREGGIDVSWSPSPEADVQLYRVYRSAADAPRERLAEVRHAETTYRDTAVASGVSYVYAVTAVDRAGNEGPPSAPFRAALP